MKKKKLLSLLRHNYITFILATGLLLVAFVVALRFLFISETNYIYARVKVSPGVWWNRVQPPAWYALSLKKGDKQYNLLGNVQAEIMQVNYYPNAFRNEYSAYITVRLAATFRKNTKTYIYQNNSVLIGSPISFEFGKDMVIGTIIDFSDRPIETKLVEKMVTLAKKYALVWEYDAIKVGDKLFNGSEVVAEVIDKTLIPHANLSYMELDIFDPNNMEQRNSIMLKLRMKLYKQGSEYVFAEEELIKRGRSVDLSLSSAVLENYQITAISN